MRRWKCLAAALFAGMAAFSCTSVDDALGLGFVPNDQQMNIGITTLDASDGILSCWVRTDSILANSRTVVFLGSYVNPLYGRTEGAPVMQCTPYDYSVDGVSADFGLTSASELDSVTLSLSITGYRGNLMAVQKFNVYEINTELEKDSTIYYINFDAESIRNTHPVFTFEYAGSTPAEGEKEIKLTKNGTIGDEFLDRLIFQSDTANYKSDSLFLKHIKGLYIVPDSPEDAALYTIYVPGTTLNLYAHKEQAPSEENPNKTYQVIKMRYTFNDSEESDDYYLYYTFRNVSIAKITHHYNAAIAPLLNDMGPIVWEQVQPDKPQETIYLQNLGGLGSGLSFTQGLIDRINALKTKDGTEYRHIIVRQARLMIEMDDRTVDNMDNAPRRAGLYYNFAPRIYRGYDAYGVLRAYYLPTWIPDYNIYYEQQGYATTFDGYLNRSHGYYNMDISSYLQKLLTDPKTPRNIFLMSAADQIFNFGEVVLKNPADGTGIKLLLTYTLVK